jgi:hypothetical protein
MHEGNNVARIDLFFGSFEGQSFLTSIWMEGHYQPCFYPNSGFSYANFFGMPMLASIDQDAYQAANYGPEYLNPKEMTGYIACTKAIAFIESNMIRLRSLHASFIMMCTAHSTSCPSPHAREVLLKRMLSFIDRVAREQGLQYVMACESHRYLLHSQKIPPMYGSIAIPQEQKVAWMTKLSSAVHTTTFTVTRGTSEGEVLQLKYSHYSPVSVGVWTASASLFHQTKDALFGDPSDLPVSVKTSSSALSGDLAGLCHGCKECEKTPTKHHWSGRLMNVNTGLCLSRASSRLTTLIDCDNVCLFTVDFCVIHFLSRACLI